MSVRRLHDVGKSGYWYLAAVVAQLIKYFMGDNASLAFRIPLSLVTIAVSFYLFCLFLKDSEKDSNGYGLSPKYIRHDGSDVTVVSGVGSMAETPEA